MVRRSEGPVDTLSPTPSVAAPAGPHRSKPSTEWVERFLEHVRQTGRPEDFPGIERSSPPEWSRPFILGRFSVDRKKRPKSDMVPCAQCAPFREKCLGGLFLVWYEQEGAVRFIGPTCGSHVAVWIDEKAAFATREAYERVIVRLETNLPLVPQFIQALGYMRPAAEEAGRLHRKLATVNAPAVELFRKIRQLGGELAVNIEINQRLGRDTKGTDKEEDEEDEGGGPVGPRGFGRGTGAIDTYTEQFGVLVGHSMFAIKFDPVQKLSDLETIARSLPEAATADNAFEWLCNNESLPLFELIVEKLRDLDAAYDALAEDLKSVRHFFSPRFFDRLRRWGCHPSNRTRLVASHNNGVYQLIHRGHAVALRPNLHLFGLASTQAWKGFQGL